MKKIIVSLCSISLAIAIVGYTPTPGAPAKDKILVGQAVALTGYLAPVVKRFEKPIMELWVQKVKAQGGLKIYPYDKKIPIELIQYDDKSDPGTYVSLYEKLITKDRCDLVFPPHGSSNTIAAGAGATNYKNVWIVWTASSAQLERSKYP